jgi:hypothetical protein
LQIKRIDPFFARIGDDSTDTDAAKVPSEEWKQCSSIHPEARMIVSANACWLCAAEPFGTSLPVATAVGAL